jgi:hypothetical protein
MYNNINNKVEQENDQLKRKGATQEIMAELVQVRAKYNAAVENHEKELQRVMRENLVQRRKLVAEVEDRVLQISNNLIKIYFLCRIYFIVIIILNLLSVVCFLFFSMVIFKVPAGKQ